MEKPPSWSVSLQLLPKVAWVECLERGGGRETGWGGGLAPPNWWVPSRALLSGQLWTARGARRLKVERGADTRPMPESAVLAPAWRDHWGTSVSPVPVWVQPASQSGTILHLLASQGPCQILLPSVQTHTQLQGFGWGDFRQAKSPRETRVQLSLRNAWPAWTSQSRCSAGKRRCLCPKPGSTPRPCPLQQQRSALHPPLQDPCRTERLGRDSPPPRLVHTGSASANGRGRNAGVRGGESPVWPSRLSHAQKRPAGREQAARGARGARRSCTWPPPAQPRDRGGRRYLPMVVAPAAQRSLSKGSSRARRGGEAALRQSGHVEAPGRAAPSLVARRRHVPAAARLPQAPEPGVPEARTDCPRLPPPALALAGPISRSCSPRLRRGPPKTLT